MPVCFFKRPVGAEMRMEEEFFREFAQLLAKSAHIKENANPKTAKKLIAPAVKVVSHLVKPVFGTTCMPSGLSKSIFQKFKKKLTKDQLLLGLILN